MLRQVAIARSQGAAWPVAFLAYSSTTAFAGSFLWIVSANADNLALLFGIGMAIAIAASLAYLSVYSVSWRHIPVRQPSANGVSERTRAAAMVGALSGPMVMLCLRTRWWLAIIPTLLLTLVSWAAMIVFWFKDSRFGR